MEHSIELGSIDGMPAFPTVNTSFMALPAEKVKNMAHNAMVAIGARRDKEITEELKRVMELKCVHRMPVLGIKMYEHPLYPNPTIALQHDPHLQEVRQRGRGAFNTCRNLHKMAEAVLSAGMPDPIINVSMSDFRSLTIADEP
jgi:hypothetical protein